MMRMRHAACGICGIGVKASKVRVGSAGASRGEGGVGLRATVRAPLPHDTTVALALAQHVMWCVFVFGWLSPPRTHRRQ